MQRSERELASADSRFLSIDGIELHYKRCMPVKPGNSSSPAGDVAAGEGAAGRQGRGAGQLPMAVHCLHGFGASCYR